MILPVFLAVVLVGLDFGRVFLGWVSLNNSARVAANYAAQNPNAWPGNLTEQAAYQQLVTNDAGKIDCVLPTPIPSPNFPSGRGIGAPAEVAITCNFTILTPIISNIIGNPLPVTAKAAFPVRGGAITGIPVGTAVPTGTPVPTPTPTATPGPSPTPTPTATPIPMCTVPDFKNRNTSAASAAWQGAGFKTSVIFSPIVPPNYTIKTQSLTKNTSQPCGTATITVGP